MNKLLALALLAACGGSKPAPVAPAPATTDAAVTPPPTSAGPLDDVSKRKHAFVRLPGELPWEGDRAPVGNDSWFQRVQQGASFDITDGAVVVVAGNVTNAQTQQVAFWNRKPHRIQCAAGADCVLFVHKNAAGEGKEILLQDIKWTQLDPARPDPLVAPLWGDGTKEANGFLMKMKAGGGPFWHIHKRDYQGVVLVGNVVSYESGTQAREMPPGSFWWQPNGNKHTTDCRGPSDCVIYLDFTGAFDVKPVP